MAPKVSTTSPKNPQSGRDTEEAGQTTSDNATDETPFANRVADEIGTIFKQALMSPLFCAVLLCTFIIIPVSCIVIGAIYFHECPAEHFIPIFLIVFGVVSGIRNFLGLCYRCINTNRRRHGEHIHYISWLQCIDFLIMIWFVVGSIWVYRITFPNYDKAGGKDYCDRTLYLFAFYFITVTYALIIIFLVITCCAICCFAPIVVIRDERNHQ